MTLAKGAAITIAATILVLLSPVAYSQDANRTNPAAGKEVTLKGCLNKADTSGEYTLTDENTGSTTTVTGPSELEKHSANHRVELTGTESTVNGKPTLQVSKIHHLSTSCTPKK